MCCRYHEEFYRPDNCCIIVTGGVAPDELIQALMPTEASIAARKQAAAAPLPRPWIRPVDPEWSGGTTEIEFPSEDESTG